MEKGFHISLIGGSHKQNGKPMQDYSSAVKGAGYDIAIVCDGHGSDKHFRSHIGSRLATEVAQEKMAEFATAYPTYKQASSNFRKKAERLKLSIVAAWMKRIEQDYTETPFTEDELCNMGRSIGADVPFCIKGGTCICEGVGEKLTRLPTFSGFYVVTAIDSSSVSTPQAFSMLDEMFGTECTDSSCIDLMAEAIRNKDIKKVCSSLYNKFEHVIIPRNNGVKLIKESFIRLDAVGTLMSGSGPSVFAIFPDEKTAANAAEYLSAFDIRANVCKTI